MMFGAHNKQRFWKSSKPLYPQKVCRDPCRVSAGSENPQCPSPPKKVLLQKRRNRKRAVKRRLCRYFKSFHGKVRPRKAQETRCARAFRKETKTAFKEFYMETCKPVDTSPRKHKNNGRSLPYGIPLNAATLNVRFEGLSVRMALPKDNLSVMLWERAVWIFYCWQKSRLILLASKPMGTCLISSAVISNRANHTKNTPESELSLTSGWSDFCMQFNKQVVEWWLFGWDHMAWTWPLFVATPPTVDIQLIWKKRLR